MRQKRDPNALADLRPNSGMNNTYQAYFEALLTNTGKDQQNASDKAAVIKYIRRRERQKRAEENKKNHHLTEDALEKQTAELMQKMEDVDIKLEHERQRQNEILQARVNEKKTKTNNILQANEILDQANEADLASVELQFSLIDSFPFCFSVDNVLSKVNVKNSKHVYPLFVINKLVLHRI